MLIEARGITKLFTGVRALDSVDFDLRSGEIHALMGENGAGKSTLIKVLTGVHAPDAGELLLDGSPLMLASPIDAQAKGISTVYQEVNLVPHLSVAENICLGREARGPLGIRWRDLSRRAEAALQRLGIHIDVSRSLGSFSVAIQQLCAVARAIDVSCKALILDEPTSSLDRHEVEQLFDILRKLRSEGLGIIFITHFLDQVFEISDRVTVLRNGQKAGEFTTASLDRLTLISSMLGREAVEMTQSRGQQRDRPDATPFVVAQDLGKSGSVGSVNLSVAPGEVIGLAGLLGSGRSEVIRLLYGIDSNTAGSLAVDGRTVNRHSTFRAIKSGMGLCPEDRKAEGILPELSVRENLLLVLQAKRGWWRRIPRREQIAKVDEFVEQLRIVTSDAEKPIQHLSGGNQQKVLLARWLAANPRLLLLDEPTRGIDIGAKFEIATTIEDLRTKGMAFVFVSSELEEVIRSSTKVAVLRDRRMVGELHGDQMGEGAVMNAIAGESA